MEFYDRLEQLLEGISMNYIRKKISPKLKPFNIVLTNHFYKRAKERGISNEDFLKLLNKLFTEKNKEKLKKIKSKDILVKDKNINVPFQKKQGDMLSAKSVFRGKDYKTNKKGQYQLDLSEVLDDILIENRSMNNQKFNESSLSRVYNDFKNTEWAMLTSWRANVDSKTNKNLLNQLKGILKSKGLGYVRVEGYGQEEEGDKVVTVREPSLFIKNVKSGGNPVMDSKDFKNFIIQLGIKYNQWGVVYSNPNSTTDLIVLKDDYGKPLSSPKVIDTMTKFSPKKTAQFFSKLKGQPFYFKESLINNITEKIKEVDGKWVVYPSKGGKRLGTHNTRKDALKQLAAIEASKSRRRKVKEAFFKVLEGRTLEQKKYLLENIIKSIN